MSQWKTPQTVNDVECAFPARVIGSLLPKWDEIPKEFKKMNGNTKYHKIASRWFFDGLAGCDLRFKNGIDAETAIRHLSSCMSSFEPKHEHKMAGVAWLMSLWGMKVKKGD